MMKFKSRDEIQKADEFRDKYYPIVLAGYRTFLVFSEGDRSPDKLDDFMD